MESFFIGPTRVVLQSTLPHGERPSLLITSSKTALLQSTLPHGERLPAGICMMRMTMLQSTLPHGERRLDRWRTIVSDKLQSTLPHGERLRAKDSLLKAVVASIHAPARGATTSQF